MTSLNGRNGAQSCRDACASKVVFQLNSYYVNPARQQCQLVFKPCDLRDQIAIIVPEEVDARHRGSFKD